MPEELNIDPWERLAELIDAKDISGLDDYLESLSPAEIARAVSRMEEDDNSDLLRLLQPGEAADLIEDLSDVQGADLIEELGPIEAAKIVEELDSDHRVDLLSEMAVQDAEAILEAMDPDAADETRQLMKHGAETAGGLMVTEFIEYAGELSYGVQYAYVCNADGALIGVLRLRDLVLSPNDKPVRDVMIPEPIRVAVDTPLEELEQLFDRYEFSGLPVVEEDGGIVGVVERVDVEEALSERTGRAFMRFSGIIAGEEMRHYSLPRRSAGRLWWLTINLGLSALAASVIVAFQETIDKEIALAALIPVLVNVSGCSGNQAVAVSIREMTMGLLQPRDFVRVVSKELGVGLINGALLGLMMFALVYTWKDNLRLAFVVGLALALNTVVAVVLGGAIPLVLKKFNLDPAAAAAPMLTTFVDMCGFFLILSLAAMLLL